MIYDLQKLVTEIQLVFWIGELKHPLSEALLNVSADNVKVWFSTKSKEETSEIIDELFQGLTKRQKVIARIILRKSGNGITNRRRQQSNVREGTCVSED